MRSSSVLVLLVTISAWADDFRVAKPDYDFQFPRDHFAHPEFQTEWWYFTGNLQTAEGRRFGFELTFFRQAVERPIRKDSPWRLDDLYLAHLALSDVEQGRFFKTERLNRAGPGLAGVDAASRRIWNGNWQIQWEDSRQKLSAVSEEFTLELDLTSLKPPVIHGRNGISRKAAGEGRASHYISFTRLDTRGVIHLGGQKHQVSGLSWMDHEFFTNQLDESQQGWDWMSIQLENGCELMLFRLRRKDGTVDPFSAGTWVDRSGQSRHLKASEFSMQPGEIWKSPATGASYPVWWTLQVPSLNLQLEARTPLKNQELVSKDSSGTNYWEGAMDYDGFIGPSRLRGRGYLEMTGYDRPIRLGAPTPAL